MTATSFEHADEARAALRSVVSDPALGPSVLDDSRVTANVLQDLLPNAPKESGLLVAAVDVGLPALLRGYRSQGVDRETAVNLAASSFAVRTAFTPEACAWVAGELAIALDWPGAPGTGPALVSPDVVTAGNLPWASYPATAFAAPPGAFELLETESPAAVGLLRLTASLSSEPVPLNLLLASPQARAVLDRPTAVIGPLFGNQAALNTAVSVLRQHGLLTDAGPNLVILPPYAGTTVLGQTPPVLAAAWRQAAAVLVEAAIPADTESVQAWPACAVLLPHAQAVLPEHSSGLARIANYLGESGQCQAALALQQVIVSARNRELGRTHPDTLSARANLAYWTGEAGDPTAARDQYAGLVGALQRTYGLEHTETMTAEGNYAFWTGKAGEPALARDLYGQLVRDYEAMLGEDDQETLAALGTLAYWTGQAGDPASARDQCAALVIRYENLLGRADPQTLDARSDLAFWTGKARNPVAAADQYSRLCLDFAAALGPAHQDTLTARRDLARWTGEAGDPAGARDQLAMLIPAFAEELGPDHPETLATRASLADWTGEADGPTLARDSFAQLRPSFERSLGQNHPDTLSVRADLAEWTGQCRDTVIARDQFTEVLAAYEKVLGPDHPDTTAVRASLAYWTKRARSRP